MASYTYFEDTSDTGDLTVTKADIEDETDIEELKFWRSELEAKNDMLVAQIEARKQAGSADDEWLHSIGHALGWTKTGIKCVGRRLIELGVEPSEWEARARAAESRIALLTSKVASLRKVSLRGVVDRVTVTVLKETVPDYVFDELMTKVNRRIAEQADLGQQDADA